MDREKILNLLDNDVDKIAVAHGLDCAQMAADKNIVKETNFLDPYQQEIITKATKDIFGVRYILEGGYPESERKKIIFYPDFLKAEDIEGEIAYLEITGSGLEKCNHRDYLGAILGLGLKREKIGDIIVFEEGCQVIVSQDIAPFILANLTKVKNVTVQVKEIYPHELKITEGKAKEITGTVASLRLDAVASLGFGISRTKVVALIKGEKVKVSYKIVNNPSYTVKEGEIISIRGRGRIEIAQVGNLTKKNRIHLKIKKYL
ncbi:RNA-binding protein YlmH, contains S4-like domain [Anaerobranca californiensis DSM 14826]|jgi:RNA-binding protein YlmH|uniref:RNA-binding protein YlmH, contains S4-like domain n=1 Tax=Anaerobranca californiensis DSM 14826 TaxID=1120989 RepID=A0A1M6KT61_9FIRM|nr:YlmH/Sll1252 family protein [Anaerobranca californiensis]SHJ62070.1 RNA-binding protein YlmH, contains S4-like domain [Anaerobranca californiensis DSM 14826]